jgi:EmrB/QacA subfamily drug resistance transporter
MNNQVAQQYQSSLPKKQVVAAMVGAMLSMLLGSMSMTITSTAMPSIITDLGGFSQYTWVFTAYIITETVSLPLTGKLSDMYGRKWFLVSGMSIFVLGSFFSGISQSMTQLIISRGLQGIGFGAMSALGFIIIADIFPPEERGKYNGLMASVMGFSTIIGPTLGGYLTDALSWRWCFFIIIPIGAIIISFFIFMFPRLQINEARHRVDYSGVVVMSLAVTSLVLALNWGGADYSWISPIILGLLIFTAVMFVVFILVEKRAEEPIIPLGLFSNRVVVVSSLVSLMIGASFFPAVSFVPLYFQGVLGASATQSGGFITPMMLSSSIGSVICGQLLSRAGGRYLLLSSIGFIITSMGYLLLTRMTIETSYATAVFNIILVGFGMGIIFPIHVLAVQNTVAYSVMGTATSVITLLRPLGGVCGLAMVGSILNNTFASSFIGNLSAGVKAVVSPEQLAGIVDNPQVLVNSGARTQLQQMFEGMGAQGQELFNQMMSTLQSSLNEALTQVFAAFFIIAVLAMIINFFLKGIPQTGVKPAGPAPAPEK